MSKKRLIDAVHEYDLESFLESIGLRETVVKGELRCAGCDKPLSLDRIARIEIQDAKPLAFCDSHQCGMSRQ